jgi:hypothetical protein
LKPFVKLVVDLRVPVGEIWVGGVQVLPGPVGDEELGRGIRTKVVRVPTREKAAELAQRFRNDGYEVEEPEST